MFFLGLLARGRLLLGCENGQVLRLCLLRLDIIGFHRNSPIDGIDLGNGGCRAERGFQCGQQRQTLLDGLQIGRSDAFSRR